LARDFDIVLLTPEDLQDRLLPTGRLREPLSSLKRAAAVVMTSDMDFTPPARIPIWRIRRSVEISNPPKSPFVFCGIAHPQKFIEQLRVAGVEPVAAKFYRDHHAYSSSDIRDLLALSNRSGVTGFITTEKDAINLGPQIDALGDTAIARVRMDLTEPTAALDTILRATGERKPSA
jgi:tetraacyldisaccharide 4'-kinase